MFCSFLNSEVKITRVMNAQAAGAANVNGSAFDMSGYDGVLFVACLGALSATQVTGLKAQQDTVVGMGTAADIAGAVTGNAADADGNKMLLLDVHKSLITKQFVRPVVTRGTANAVIDSVIAIQYRARKLPAGPDATTTSQSKNAA